ncbi:MAG TPA: hypothetical protein VFG79_05010 [Solirubrobacter sp.]|nr:hypothetical protein [Solirubrobacter sp.]
MTYKAIAPGTIVTTPTTSFNPVNAQDDPDLTNNAVTTDVAVTGITASPPSFADQSLGTLGPAKIVAVTNDFSQSVTFGGLPVTGAAALDYFRSADSCAGATLAVGNSCQLTLSFAPDAFGARAARIDLAPTSGPIDPLQLDLAGNGIPLPVDFGPTGSQGAAGPQGAPGPPRALGLPARKLTLASAVKRLAARHGRTITLRYASTSNRIRWNGRSHGKAAKAGRYVLRSLPNMVTRRRGCGERPGSTGR